MKRQRRLDVGKCSFCEKTINEWNTLSADYIHSRGTNMFVNRMDNDLVRAGYT